MESIESNKPPLPGITLPESFSLADLFKRDSTKSPKMDAIATDSPSRICIVKDALKSSGHIREETVAPSGSNKEVKAVQNSKKK